ncbi:MAG: T9SS type A sorting domain-containing protein [Ignavibacteriaceae bacterium]|nr:T9SS type A sorting domain-containing protein [Ignavibacteriaceae bacterium]
MKFKNQHFLSFVTLFVFILGFSFVKAQEMPSAGPIPSHLISNQLSQKNVINSFFDGTGTTAFAFQTYPTPTNFVTFPIPGYTTTVVGSHTFTDFASAGAFAPNGTFFLTTVGDVSGTSQLYTVDTTTGVPTLVANMTGSITAGVNGLAFDPTSGIAYICTEDTLGTINTATGVTTTIGPLNNTGGLMVKIVIDDDGHMYGIDLGTDNLYSINKSTGQATVIGPLGFNLNFGCGATFDRVNGVLYLLGLDGGSVINALRTIDTATGTATTVHTWSPTLSQFAPFDLYSNISTEPSMTEIHFPQYMQGLNGSNNGRIPMAYFVELNGLTPGATYRYFNLLDTVGSPANGAGIIMFAEPSGYRYSSTGNLSNPDNYGEFTADGSGSYSGWFVSIPSGNAARFTPGKELTAVICLNDGAGGTSIEHRLRSTQTVKVVNWGTTPSDPLQGSLFWGQSTNGTDKNVIMLYDNVDGTGRPISSALIENIGFDLTTVSSILPEYRTNIATQSGRWGTIIPNNLPNGIRRLEERELVSDKDAPGDLVQFITEPSGNWNGVANTVNPSNGSAITLVYNGPLPVDLISFNAMVDRNNVTLNWETAWEENNDRFEIQRKVTGTEAWVTVGSVKGSGTTYEHRSYSYFDKNLVSGAYEYRLVQYDVNGNNTADFGLTGSVMIGTPENFKIAQNYPNPFNPVTKIDFQLPIDAMVTLKVFDLTGREVAQVVNEFKTAGYYSVQFDGSSLASGMYIYQISAGEFIQMKKMLLVK